MTKRKRLSRKTLDRIRAKRLGDLKHALECCRTGRLPAKHIDFLERALGTPDRLPSRNEVKERLQLPYEDQQAHKLYSIPCIDKTEAQLRELRKERNRERMRRARRKANVRPRKAYLAQIASDKPWLRECPPVSERTWYRRKRKAEGDTGCVRTPESQLGSGYVQTSDNVAEGVCAGNRIIGAHTPTAMRHALSQHPRASRGCELLASSLSPIAWSELDWVNMNPDKVEISLAAMEAYYWERAPGREARRAREQEASLARAAVEITSHASDWQARYGSITMAERDRRQIEADARL